MGSRHPLSCPQEILTDRFDIGFLGPGDLALSMGVEAGHPDHEAALQRFREGCHRAGKPSGIPAKDPASVRQRLAEGFRFIDLNNDLRFLESTARKMLGAVTDEQK